MSPGSYCHEVSVALQEVVLHLETAARALGYFEVWEKSAGLPEYLQLDVESWRTDHPCCCLLEHLLQEMIKCRDDLHTHTHSTILTLASKILDSDLLTYKCRGLHSTIERYS